MFAAEALQSDGLTRPEVSGTLDVVLHCDPHGNPGVATPTNASLILSGDASDSARYVPYRLDLKSKCACPGGCTSPQPPGGAAPPGPAVQANATLMAPGATMPADGTLIVRLQHLYGRAEGFGPLAEPATIDLASLFCTSGKTIAAVREVSMSANQKIEDV